LIRELFGDLTPLKGVNDFMSTLANVVSTNNDFMKIWNDIASIRQFSQFKMWLSFWSVIQKSFKIGQRDRILIEGHPG